MMLVFGDAASFLVDVETSAKAGGETFEKLEIGARLKRRALRSDFGRGLARQR